MKKISINSIDPDTDQCVVNFSSTNFRQKTYSLVELMLIYKSCIASEMLALGYILVPVNGNYEVVSPQGSVYQLHDYSCSCPDFVVGRNTNSPCKHLLFRDWHIEYQKKIEKYKQDHH